MKNYTKKEVLKAVKDSLGVMSNVAVTLGCSWHTAKKYVKQWPETENAFDVENSKLVGLACEAFFKAVKSGERWAVERILDTKARRAGFGIVSPRENSESGGCPVQYEVVTQYDEKPD